jgi:hypothetical protein
MLPDEVAWFPSRETHKLPDRRELFVTPLTDVEHQFCKPEHLAAALGIPLEDAKTIIDGIISASNASLSIDFANNRTEPKSKTLKLKDNIPSAADLVGGLIEFRFVKGKRLFGLLNAELPKLAYINNFRSFRGTRMNERDLLTLAARRKFGWGFFLPLVFAGNVVAAALARFLVGLVMRS